MKHYPVIVAPLAKKSLKEITTYIKKDSPSAARHVRRTIIALMETLGTHPEKFSKEVLLEGKKKNYRSVTQWHYKIVYLFTGKEVHVLDIIHTSMNPEEVKKS